METQNPTKYYSTIQEKQISKYLGWKPTPASGARPFNPGDIISEDYMGECKTHTKQVRRVEFVKAVWEKIESEAMSSFKTPVLLVDNGTQDIKQTWCMVPIRVVAKDLSYVDNTEMKLLRESGKKFSFKPSDWIEKMQNSEYLRLRWGKHDVAVLTLTTFHQVLGGD